MLGGLQYSDETAGLLARQLLDGATPETRIAVVSAPSVFVALKNILVSPPPLPGWLRAKIRSCPARPIV